MNEDLKKNEYPEHPSHFGAILSALIVVLMVILALLYAWSEQLLFNKAVEENTPTFRPTKEQNNEPESTTAEAEVETLGAMSTSDELGAIESDLASTPFDDETFNARLENVETELMR